MKTELLRTKPFLDLLEGMINICYRLQFDRIGRGGGGQETFCMAKFGNLWFHTAHINISFLEK